jgi:hypothetical protein
LTRLSPEDWSRGGRRGLNLLHERRDGSLEPAELAVKLFASSAECVGEFIGFGEAS